MTCIEGSMAHVIYLLLLTSLAAGKRENTKQDRSPQMHNGFELDNTKAIRRGKERLQEYESKVSPCWMKAVEELQSKCSEMDDIERSILAMKLANCHFEKSGLTTYDCTDKANFQQCTSCMKTIDSSSFLVYTEFFTHVTDICFYLQSEVWRQRNADMVSLLSQTTGDTIAKLDHSLSIQKTVLYNQNKSLMIQRENVESAKNVKVTLESLTISARAAYSETKQQTDGLKALHKEVFGNISQNIDTLKELQVMFLGEIMTLYSLAFYIKAFVVCYLVSSTPYTIKARIWLFLLLLLLAMVEKALTGFALSQEEIHRSSTIWIHDIQYWLRTAFKAVSILVLFYFMRKYEDPIAILKRIEEKQRAK